ncbi:MAG: hypothetical protein JRH10_10575 [Deltaproteobacteria bacterium]|nr:hypothetical protein [Deltaproteobacteria bacterium]MBW2447698.1 hypothetical protein [Deltaproteobacteria bacterium]
MFGYRPDAKLAEGVPAIRRFMPLISPRRNESLFYFKQEVNVERALEFLDEINVDRPPERRVTLFHLVLQALTLMYVQRPRLNRFTQGGRIWQRDGIYISFSAKVRMDDDAPLITVKRKFDPKDDLLTMVDGLLDSLQKGRSGKKTTSDNEMGLLLRLPPFIVRIVLRLVMALDNAGLLPRAMIEPDPMHATIFMANLGSVGLEGGWHHLWEYGNIPIFGVVGKIYGEPGARHVTFNYSYDERIEDGLYAARGLELIKEFLARPEDL